MKSLIIKDLYNIGHNAGIMLLMLVVYAFIFTPSSGPGSYIVVGGVLCGMMVPTTFSFDEFSHWNKYALSMPVSKKELVAGKYILLLIFTVSGIAVCFTVSVISSLFLHNMDIDTELLLTALGGFLFALVYGSTLIPFLFRFGTEKSRMLMLLIGAAFVGIIFGTQKLLKLLGYLVTDQQFAAFICCFPLFVLPWIYGSYKISCHIVARMELS